MSENDRKAHRASYRIRYDGQSRLKERIYKDAQGKRVNLNVTPPRDVSGPPPTATRDSSGLAYRTLKAGTGKIHPKSTASVKVHYTGWTTDGQSFDSTMHRGEPSTFQLGRVMKGWRIGVMTMVAGEKKRFWIPGDLAFGDTPKANRPHGMLVFDIELVEVNNPKTPPVPEDVAAPPPTATMLPSGLAYRLLRRGTGKRRPRATSRIRVHYSGWMANGKMFDSSLTHGKPAEFSLNGVIRGWREGLPLMVVGDKMRLWIPGSMAYGNTPKGNRPFGMLVFDVELLKILER